MKLLEKRREKRRIRDEAERRARRDRQRDDAEKLLREIESLRPAVERSPNPPDAPSARRATDPPTEWELRYVDVVEALRAAKSWLHPDETPKRIWQQIDDALAVAVVVDRSEPDPAAAVEALRAENDALRKANAVWQESLAWIQVVHEAERVAE